MTTSDELVPGPVQPGWFTVGFTGLTVPRQSCTGPYVHANEVAAFLVSTYPGFDRGRHDDRRRRSVGTGGNV